MHSIFRSGAWLLLLLALGLPAQARLSDAEALNTAGLQRMLSQRTASAYLMLGAEVRSERAAEQLAQGRAQVEVNLQALRDYVPAQDIEAALHKSQQSWQVLDALLGEPPRQERVAPLLDAADAFLADSEALVRAIEQHSGQSTAQLVSRCGRQRMLSQRIAALYLALSWVPSEVQRAEEFERTVAAFEEGLQALRQAPQNSAQISQALDQAEAQWRFARAGFRLAEDARYVPTVVVTTSESLLWKMDALTGEYQRLLETQP
jgi:nitrate/nitrite-specific signal transduction histidine kinase